MIKWPDDYMTKQPGDRTTTPDLSVVIVNWNVKGLLRRCLQSVISNQTRGTAEEGLSAGDGCGSRASPRLPVTTEIIVVDNASTDGSAVMVEAEFPQVRLIVNPVNRGFAAGTNQGLALSRGRYVLLLNPDTEVLDGALTEMVAYLERHPDVGVVGPQLLYPDGRIQSSRRRFPTLATAFLESTILQQWFPHNPVLTRYYVLDRPDDQEQDVDWVTGACLMTRREVLDQVGLLDEGYVMYSEEMDWCRSIKSQGWRVVYLPTARVVHHEGKSSEQVVPARHIMFQSSKVRYFRKHHGAFWGETLRVFLLATYVYQLIEEGLKWLVGHKRPLRRQRLAAYWRVLRSGLSQ